MNIRPTNALSTLTPPDSAITLPFDRTTREGTKLKKIPEREQEGLMRLKAYLEETQMNESQFARWIGASSSIVSRWIAGTQRPSWKFMIIIMEKTGYRVTPNDFADIPPALIAPQVRRAAANFGGDWDYVYGPVYVDPFENASTRTRPAKKAGR